MIAFKPYGPSIPQAVDVTPTSLTLSWKVPDKSGGSPVDRYELQYQQLDAKASSDSNWVSVDTDIQETMFVIFDLRFKQYVFRVRGHNEFGWGEFSENSEPVRITRRF